MCRLDASAKASTRTLTPVTQAKPAKPPGMHLRDLLCLGQRCTLQLAWQSEAVAAFPLQTRFALQTRLMWKNYQ